MIKKPNSGQREKGMTKEILISMLQAQGYDAITACELVTKFMIIITRLDPGDYGFIVGKEEVTIKVSKKKHECICGQGIGIVRCPIHGFTGGLRK